jgi:hypothetical protein
MGQALRVRQYVDEQQEVIARFRDEEDRLLSQVSEAEKKLDEAKKELTRMSPSGVLDARSFQDGRCIHCNRHLGDDRYILELCSAVSSCPPYVAPELILPTYSLCAEIVNSHGTAAPTIRKSLAFSRRL